LPWIEVMAMTPPVLFGRLVAMIDHQMQAIDRA